MLATTGVFAVLVGGRGACRAVEDHRHRGSLPPAKTRQDFFPPVHHRIDSEARPPSRGRDELKRRACKPHRDVMAWLMGRLDRRCGLAGTPRTCAAEHGELVGCRRRGHHRALRVSRHGINGYQDDIMHKAPSICEHIFRPSIFRLRNTVTRSSSKQATRF